MSADHPIETSSEYRSWISMTKRCRIRTGRDHKNYVKRGITICERWLGANGFANFFADMGPKPTPKHTIERKDNDKGYSKENCCWATKKEQAQNRRSSHLLTWNGRTQCLKAWAEEFGLAQPVLWNRLYNHGWTLEDALIRPIRPIKRREPITWSGKTQSLADWSRELAIPHNVLSLRLQNWTLERSMTEPYVPYKKRHK